MAININNIVNVSGVVINAGGITAPALIANALTENQLVANTATLSFPSLTAVGNYFGTSSDEYMFAKTYFSSYTNTPKYPTQILFSRYTQTASSAYMFSNQLTNSVVASIVALTTPALTVSINGTATPLTLTQALFASCKGLTDVATVLQTALQAKVTGATVKVIGINQMCITAPTTTPATTTISYCSGNVSDLLQLSLAQNPTLSQGTTGGNAAWNMSNIINNNPNWIALSYVKRLTGDTLVANYAVTVDLCSWIATQSNNYIGLLWEGGTAPLISLTNTTPTNVNIATTLVNAGYGDVEYNSSGALQIVFNIPIQVDYNGNQIAINSATSNEVGIYSAFVAGIGASIDYQNATKIAFSGKQQSGLLTNINNNSGYLTLLSNGYNVYGQFASRTTTYNYTETGSIGGQYLFIDNIYDSVWLASNNQNAVAGLIQNTGILTYDQEGQNLVRSALEGNVTTALQNGVISVGNTFSATQRQEIYNLVGADVTPQLTANGYYIYFPQIQATDKSARNPLNVGFIYCNSGAIIQVNINQVFVS